MWNTVNRNTTTWSLGGTDSLRLASKKVLDNWGSNLQNPSNDICKLYIPDEGKLLIQVDQAGAEAFVVAYLTKHGAFRDLFLNGIKSHVFVAMHIFADHWIRNGHPYVADYLKLPIKDLKKQPGWKAIARAIKNHERYYFIGKKSCHSFNYMMQPPTFMMDVLKESEGKVALTREEAEQFYSIYHSLFPEIGEWHRETENLLRQTRTLYNLFGYPRYFDGPFTPKFFREAISFIPQSTVGVITEIASVQFQELIEEESLDGWDFLNNKHDSILAQSPKEQTMYCAFILSNLLQQELTSPTGEKFTMRTEASIGRNWGKYNKEDNAKGLREIHFHHKKFFK